MSIDTAITTAVIANILMVITYAYLYIQYRHGYFAKWTIAWLLHGLRMAFSETIYIHQSSKLVVVGYIVISFIYSLLVISGTTEFVGKKLSKIWTGTGMFLTVIICFAAIIDIPQYIYMIPGVLFIGSVYIATGIVIRGINIKGIGKTLTSWGFILVGLHLFDMPFLLHINWIAPWGYLLDGVLRFFVAIGIIFVYYEKTRNELDKQRIYYKLLTENATDVIYRYRIIGGHQGFEYISPAIKQLIGYESDDIKSIKDILNIVHHEDRRKINEIIRVMSNNDGFVSFRLRHKNGELVWAEQKASLFFDPDGRPATVDGIVRDVTKRVLLEQDVARLDRLNIAGQMAASLAHEVRNPLTTVQGYLQLMGSRPEFQSFKDQFFMLLNELDRTNGIITEYLSLSKDKLLDIKRRSLNDIVLALHALIQADAVVSKVEVRLKLAKIPELFLDDKEIKQLLLNLTRNAIEAMPAGGLLEIETGAGGGEVFLSVRDQGPGMSQEILQNLGKPFITTKEGGTGLGLAICYRIAGRHNAKLNIETGQTGTMISIRFRKH